MQFHMLALFSGISPLISSSKRALSPPPSLSLLQKAPPFRDTVFPVSLSQTLSVLPPTKKIEGSARDDDTRRMRFPHTLSLHDARDIHSLHCHFERSEKSFSSPFSHDSFVKSFRGSTVPAFPAIRCFPFFAIGHSPSCRQRKRSLDDDTGNVLSQHNLFPIYGNAHFPPFY